MTYPRVICIGEILFDLLADQLGLPLEQVESWTPYPGGAPANVACALVKLGTPAAFVGCVGEDAAGNELVQLLQDTGVDTTGVQRHPTAPSRQIYVVRSSAGDRSFAGFGALNTADFADTRLQADQLPESLFETADFLILGTLELAYPETRNAIERSLELASRHNVQVVMDVNWRPMFWQDTEAAKDVVREAIAHTNFLKLSDEEAELLFDTTDIQAITQRFTSIRGTLITAGENGCCYYLGGQVGKLPAFNVQSVDTTGAGDGFLAGFVHQLCQQGVDCLQNADTAKQIANYASAVGALTTLKPGAIAAQPTREEVEQFLQAQGHKRV